MVPESQKLVKTGKDKFSSLLGTAKEKMLGGITGQLKDPTQYIQGNPTLRNTQ